MVQTVSTGAKPVPTRGRWKWRLYYAFLAIALLYILVSGLIATLTRNTPLQKRLDDEAWISSSRFWLDRQLCRWIGCCGTFHMLNHAGWTWHTDKPKLPVRDFSDFWHAGTEDPSKWSPDERSRREIPEYVFEYAPYVHLYSGEQYWPSDIAEHLVHVTPWINHTSLPGIGNTLDLANLSQLNDVVNGSAGRDTYLHSDDNIEVFPAWLKSEYNIPPHSTTKCTAKRNAISDDGRCGGPCDVTCQGSLFGNCCSMYGYCGSGLDYCGVDCNSLFGHCYATAMAGRYEPHIDLKRRDVTGGTSGAPVILIVVPKEDGIVDAFWFFFYSYNLGKRVLNIRFGNHVGDWEHTMIRFKQGKPVEAFLSAHSWGAAFDFDALEKYAPDPQQDDIMLSSWGNATAGVQYRRPIVFSAEGSHAMYATAAYHDYVAPFGILHDDTNRGPLWDPLKNVKSFTYDVKEDHFRSSTANADAPTEWLHYAGHWGDRFYLLSDPRQYRFAGEYHYNNGPTGPKFKNLGREHSCINPGKCVVHKSAQRQELGLHVLHEAGEMPENSD